MRRLFWVSVGAAAGYYAAKKGTVAVEDARARGLVGNVTLAAETATKLAAGTARAVASAGQAAGSRARTSRDARNHPATTTGVPVTTTRATSAPAREVRP